MNDDTENDDDDDAAAAAAATDDVTLTLAPPTNVGIHAMINALDKVVQTSFGSNKFDQ
jgi:hypothetical protein